MEKHQDHLRKLCRVCGERNFKNATRRSQVPESRRKVRCDMFARELKETWSITINTDEADIHPMFMCLSCKRKMQHCVKSKNSRTDSFQWSPHKRSSTCKVCRKMETSSHGSRTKRVIQPHLTHRLPFRLNSPNIFTELITPNTSSMTTVDPHHLATDDSDLIELYTCLLCNQILTNPIITPCQHHFCSLCLSRQFQKAKSSIISCRRCYHTAEFQNICSIPRSLQIAFRSQHLTCNNCNRTYPLPATHKCDPPNPTIPTAEAITNLALAHPPSEPIPSPIANAVGAWVGVMMKTDGSVELKCNPKAKKRFTIAKIIKANKLLVSARQRRRRREKVQKINNVVKGKYKSRNPYRPMSCNTMLAMIVDADLTSGQTRKISRYISTTGLPLPSEKRCSNRKELLLESTKLTALSRSVLAPSTQAASIKGFMLADAPVVYIGNILYFFLNYLDRLDKANLLTWHDGTIPSDEVWMKCGGDYGGGSFKFVMHVVNTEKPNSPSNTICVVAQEAKDKKENIRPIMERMQEQLMALQEAKWRGKQIRLWAYGDLEYLNMVYGLNGCAARHCCILCDSSRAEFQKAEEERPRQATARTVKTMKEDHQAFVRAGARKEQSKDISHSIIDLPMLPIPIDHVAIPSLHLWLGIYKKLYDMFVREVHALDQKAFLSQVRITSSNANADEETLHDTLIRNEQMRVRSLKRQLELKTEEVDELMADIPLKIIQTKNPPPEFKELYNRYEDTEEEMAMLEQELQDGELPFGKGHLVSGIDDVLQKCGVARQAYQGGCFVGNHVSKMLTDNSIDALTKAPIEMLEEDTGDDIPLQLRMELLADANKLQTQFSQLFHHFAKARKLVAHSKPIGKEKHTEIEQAIQEFFSYLRSTFPAESITLKLHYLENHVLKEIKCTGFGLGLLSEQGLELTHNKWNRIKKNVANMGDKVKRFKTVMRKHLIRIMPEVSERIRQPKKSSLEE